ncbi:GNAT family N-acetyltransferase [Streptomyces sp. SL13]|uniref:Lysine N-acyltransferase MbtK n=1 Tax=Streptantibioticus silvisoli TaxID=2705255 RepID=A0AA90KB06_9ACTN|nr:GNAT family N-acetyltransferase [Streptantibioticus silvisoli]MDI5966404.1 GNAT family N-acetyltransferase [Streptantibioticus silvisoli]MDI5973048.1 GNAT family N-acetyltransferase [Streptantibioticus silvisoli]
MPPTDFSATTSDGDPGARHGPGTPAADRQCSAPGDSGGALALDAEDDTLDLALPDDLADLAGPLDTTGTAWPAEPGGGRYGDLLDGLPGWGPVDTERGTFQLLPVEPGRDLRLITRWMNDPSVAEFWALAGPEEATRRHLDGQLGGDGRSAPCLGVLDGTPMSYWEVYRADLDPLARFYPARPHDTGLHLLLGTVADRGRGLGGALLRAVADLILLRRPACARVVAEPDLRNTPSVAAFLTAGFRFAAELDLPDKRAALMVRDRRTSHFM